MKFLISDLSQGLNIVGIRMANAYLATSEDKILTKMEMQARYSKEQIDAFWMEHAITFPVTLQTVSVHDSVQSWIQDTQGSVDGRESHLHEGMNTISSPFSNGNYVSIPHCEPVGERGIFRITKKVHALREWKGKIVERFDAFGKKTKKRIEHFWDS